jgi:hypothetical protein
VHVVLDTKNSVPIPKIGTSLSLPMVVDSKNREGNFVTMYGDTSVNNVTAEQGHVPMVIIFYRNEN